MKKIGSLALLVAASQVLFAQATPKELVLPPSTLGSRLKTIESLVDSKRKELGIPGVALAIVMDDKVIYSSGLGLRDVERKLPVTSHTVFAIGSSTKAFTAMTVMMEADQNKLSLTDKPSKYLPYFKLKDADANEKITISNLLCHNSGLERTDLMWITGKLSEKEIITNLANCTPTAKLGEKFQYSNPMFLTAGEIVSSIEHKPWVDVLNERIFMPLEMTETSTSTSLFPTLKDSSQGYAYDPIEKKPIHLPYRPIDCVAPAGAINSNVTDMAKWVLFMLNRGVVGGKRLVSESNFDELIKKHSSLAPTVSYGYGWFLRDYNGIKVVEHGGNIDGFNAQVAFVPDKHIGFVLLTNVSASSLGQDTIQYVCENLLGKPKVNTTPVAKAGPMEKEVGTYYFAALKVNVTVAIKDGKLTMDVPGQTNFGLENVGGRKYKLAQPPVPDAFVTFQAPKDKPADVEMLLEQSGQKFICQKTDQKPVNLGITVDEIMSKAIEAKGGEAAIRKSKSTLVEADISMDTQGITATSVAYTQSPNRAESMTRFFALGKEILWSHSVVNGKKATEYSNLSGTDIKSGTGLADALIQADYFGELNWKTHFPKAVLSRKDKIGNEEVYVVELTPTVGTPTKLSISTKSFRVLGQEIGSVKSTFGDFRTVDGVLHAFTTTVEVPGQGPRVVKIKSIKYDVPKPLGVF